MTRDLANSNGVFGTLVDEGDNQLCVTLEHAYLVRGNWTPKLSVGTYTCERYLSPEHGYELFVVRGVPDFMGQPVTFIELHIGNYNCDSTGCVLLGDDIQGIMITKSKDAFERFMALQAGVDSFSLVVK